MTEDLPVDKIVSSRHLAEGEAWEAAEFEYGLITVYNAFTRWTMRCMAAAGSEKLSALEILVLHNVHHRDRPKRLVDICFVLNIEDAHVVTYALKKLSKAGLISQSRKGKEVFYKLEPAGLTLCDSYREIRARCLLNNMASLELSGEKLRILAGDLRIISGHYSQAGRAAAVI